VLRLGVLSDTHLGRAEPGLEKLLRGALHDVDLLVHAGDYTAEAVVDHLSFVDGRPFFGVAGNADPAAIRRRLPAVRRFEAGGIEIGLVHVLPESGAAGLFDSAPALLIFGHTHRPFVGTRGKTLLLNPGSAFDRRGAPAHTVAIVEIDPGGPKARIVELSP